MDEAKLQTRVDGSYDDTLLTNIIKASRQYVEKWTGLAIGRQTIDEHIDNWPGGSSICLSVAPVQSVTAVTYVDIFGQNHTIAGFYLAGGAIALNYGLVWPDIQLRVLNPITIRYVAGYTTDELPAPIRSAMLLLIGHLYSNRESTSERPLHEIPMGVEALISPWRIRRWFG